jgi:hypothetical protein
VQLCCEAFKGVLFGRWNAPADDELQILGNVAIQRTKCPSVSWQAVSQNPDPKLGTFV